MSCIEDSNSALSSSQWIYSILNIFLQGIAIKRTSFNCKHPERERFMRDIINTKNAGSTLPVPDMLDRDIISKERTARKKRCCKNILTK